MKYKLGIYGSAAGDFEAMLPIATELGKALQNYAEDLILITGACPGLPYAVIHEAASSGIEIWGFSSSVDLASHQDEYPDDDHSIYSKLVYVPADFPFVSSDRPRKKYRNVISTASCDAAIILSGRWGTLNEFTNLIDFQKAVGILTGTGGIADEMPALAAKISKAGQGQIIYDDNPEQLIKKLLEALTAAKSS
jgi:hypothetical protein